MRVAEVQRPRSVIRSKANTGRRPRPPNSEASNISHHQPSSRNNACSAALRTSMPAPLAAANTAHPHRPPGACLDLTTARGGLIEGARAVAHGARLLGRHPAWWLWVIAPAVITAVSLIAAVVGTFRAWPGVAAAAAGALGVARPGLAWGALSAASFLAVLAGLSVLAVIVGQIAAGPFLDLLSARVEREACGRGELPSLSIRDLARDLLASVVHSLAILSLYLALACPLTFLQLVPVFGQVVAVPAALALAAMYLAREAWDYPMSRRRWGLARKLRAVRAATAPALGLGLGGVALLAIPIINLLAMPVVVVGGTWLFVKLEDDGVFPAD